MITSLTLRPTAEARESIHIPTKCLLRYKNVPDNNDIPRAWIWPRLNTPPSHTSANNPIGTVSVAQPTIIFPLSHELFSCAPTDSSRSRLQLAEIEVQGVEPMQAGSTLGSTRWYMLSSAPARPLCYSPPEKPIGPNRSCQITHPPIMFHRLDSSRFIYTSSVTPPNA